MDRRVVMGGREMDGWMGYGGRTDAQAVLPREDRRELGTPGLTSARSRALLALLAGTPAYPPPSFPRAHIPSPRTPACPARAASGLPWLCPRPVPSATPLPSQGSGLVQSSCPLDRSGHRRTTQDPELGAPTPATQAGDGAQPRTITAHSHPHHAPGQPPQAPAHSSTSSRCPMPYCPPGLAHLAPGQVRPEPTGPPKGPPTPSLQPSSGSWVPQARREGELKAWPGLGPILAPPLSSWSPRVAGLSYL